MKLRGRLGPGDRDDACVRIPNKIVTWTEEGTEDKADQRHAEVIIKQVGVHEKSNSLSTPGVKDTKGSSVKLKSGDATTFRAVVARANYLAQDRSDIQFAIKELCRKMSDPEETDWIALNRLGSYLIGAPRVIVKFKYQGQCLDRH